MTALLNQPRAARIMDELGVDGLLGGSFENVYYLSGLWSENFFVLPRQTQVFALVSRDRLDLPRLVAGMGEALLTKYRYLEIAYTAFLVGIAIAAVSFAAVAITLATAR